MGRFFNTAGPCNPEDHYMLPPDRRLPGIRELIDDKLYFVIHAPRQVGKTTCFRTLAQQLTAEGRYVAVHTSCEMGQAAGGDVGASEASVLASLRAHAQDLLDEPSHPPAPEPQATAGNRLYNVLSRWSQSLALPLVVFFDEIDALMDESLISALRQLRDGYMRRPDDFPQSVALIGLRDVRDYKVRLRPDAHSLGTSSPFNIKVESLTIRDFTAEEVAELYAQHTAETGQAFGEGAASLAFHLTQGQPWLVNALARQVTVHDVTDRATPITAAHIEAAKETLIQRRDTHLDSLIDRLREDRVRRVIEPLLTGGLVLGDRIDDALAFTEDLGLVKRTGTGHVQIANPIYQEVIPRALAAITQATIPHETAWYLSDDGRLEMDALVDGFLDFWLEHAEALLMHQPYPEAAPHLVLMAFVQRVVNGGGFIDREYAVGSGRMDLCVRWPHQGGLQREAIEIKVWRTRKADPIARGSEQLAAYLERLGLDEGFLFIFDQRDNAPEVADRVERSQQTFNGKRLKVVRL